MLYTVFLTVWITLAVVLTAALTALFAIGSGRPPGAAASLPAARTGQSRTTVGSAG